MLTLPTLPVTPDNSACSPIATLGKPRSGDGILPLGRPAGAWTIPVRQDIPAGQTTAVPIPPIVQQPQRDRRKPLVEKKLETLRWGDQILTRTTNSVLQPGQFRYHPRTGQIEVNPVRTIKGKTSLQAIGDDVVDIHQIVPIRRSKLPDIFWRYELKG